MFVLLAKRRRRQLLRILWESTTPQTARELAERIGEREYESPSIKDQRLIYLSLYHSHLPRLDEADVIVYDEDEGTVVPDVNFDSLVRVLERVGTQDKPWSDE